MFLFMKQVKIQSISKYLEQTRSAFAVHQKLPKEVQGIWRLHSRCPPGPQTGFDVTNITMTHIFAGPASYQ